MLQRFWDSGEGFPTVARLLHAADEDALRNDSDSISIELVKSDHDAAGLAGSRTEFEPAQYQSWLDRGELLKQLGFQTGRSIISVFVFYLVISCQIIPRQSLAAMLSVLVKLGGDVNSVDFYGVQPLHWMMYCSSTEKNSDNFTALTVALLQNGADPCALDNDGSSTLEHAESHGWTVKWYKALEEAGFDVREVEREIEERQWCYHQGGAYVLSTGVDEDDVVGPSTEGLSLRRAVVGDRLDE